MVIYEAVKLPRDIQRLPVPELKRYYRDETSWQPNDGQQIPVQIDRLEALAETNLVDGKLTERELRLINRAIERDGMFVGRNYVVRSLQL